ncbi:hypothetical protein [Peribacillus simplex]
MDNHEGYGRKLADNYLAYLYKKETALSNKYLLYNDRGNGGGLLWSLVS